MKKVLACILSLLLATGSVAFAETTPVKEYDFCAPGNYLGFQVLALMTNGKENCAISPISLALCLSMLGEGASDGTRDEIVKMIDIADCHEANTLKNALNASGLSIANAAFVSPEVEVKESYKGILKDYYDGEFFALGSDGSNIQEWAKEKTNGLISDFNPTIDPSTLLVLTNAVAMDAKWAYKFKPESTYTDEFITPDGPVSVEFMHQTFEDNIEYAETSGAQVLKLPYRDSGLYMLIAYPGEGGFDYPLLNDLVFKGLNAFKGLQPIEDAELVLSIPKFDITTSVSLKEFVDEAGIQKIFAADAEIFNIADRPLNVDDIIQETRIQMDEEGTKAASVTAMLLAAGCMMNTPKETIEMDVKAPFLVLVVDEATDVVCFAAIIAHPESTN